MSLNLIRFCRHFVRCGCRRKPHLDMRLGSGRGGVAQFIRNARFHAAPKIALYVFADLPHQCNCGRLSRKSLSAARVARWPFSAARLDSVQLCLYNAPETDMRQRCTLRRKFVLFSRPETGRRLFKFAPRPNIARIGEESTRASEG